MSNPGTPKAGPGFVPRAIRSDDEERRWGDLCGKGFSHRPGDPTRFYKKLLADPQCPRSGVRVVVAPTGAFVGSVRVLQRDIDVDGRVVSTAGIAEVCTDPEYRGQGVAGVAMPDSMAYVDNESGCDFSLLHAASAVAPLYARYGYVPLHVSYSRVAINAAEDVTPLHAALLPEGAVIRSASLDDSAETTALDALHAALHARMGCTGFTHRSTPYWQRWLPVVAGSGYRVLEVPDATAGTGKRIVAYVCVIRKDEIKVWDCGFDEAALPASAAFAFVLSVAASVVAREVSTGKLAQDAAEAGSLLLPSRLADILCSPGIATADPESSDAGWMARPIAGATVSAAIVDALVAASAQGRYVVWVADSF